MLAGQVLILTLIIYFNQLDLINSQEQQTGCSKFFKFKPTTIIDSDPKLNSNNKTSTSDEIQVSFSESSSFNKSSSSTESSTESLPNQKSGSKRNSTVQVNSKRNRKRDTLDLNQHQNSVVQEIEPDLRTINEKDDQFNVLLAKTGFSKFSKHPKSKHSISKEQNEIKNQTTLNDNKTTSLNPTGDITDNLNSSLLANDKHTTNSFTSTSNLNSSLLANDKHTTNSFTSTDNLNSSLLANDKHTTNSFTSTDNLINQDNQLDKGIHKNELSSPKLSSLKSKSEGFHAKGIQNDLQTLQSNQKPKTPSNPLRVDQISNLTLDSLLQPTEIKNFNSSDLNLNSKLKINLVPNKILNQIKDFKIHQSFNSLFKPNGNVEIIPNGNGICGQVFTDNVLGVCIWSGSDQTGLDLNQSGWLTTKLNSNCGKEVIVSRSDNPSITITAKIVDGCGFNQLKAEVGCSEIYLTKMAFISLKPNELESKLGHLNNIIWKFKDSTQIN